jgi:hypothetical protein
LFEEMGLGWSLGHFKGVKPICHGGAGFGGTPFLLILPEKNCAAVILCNEESNTHSACQPMACYVALPPNQRLQPARLSPQ